MTLVSIKKKFAQWLIFFFNLLPIKQNKVFFYSYYGSQYGCNPKYISEYLLTYHPDKFDIVWAFDDPDNKISNEKYRTVKIMSWRYFYEMCTSKIVITNYRTTDLFKKRKEQYYIQTWHSSLRLKQIEQDTEDMLPESYVEMAKKDSEKCDLLLSGCELSTTIFERVFWYNGEIFKKGTPRNDLFFNEQKNKRQKILNELGLSSQMKVALYAPTFRKDNSLDVYNIDYQRLIGSLTRRFGGEWVVLVKLHPHLVAESNQLTYGEKVINVSTYDDIQELLYVADVLLSDYSSLIFDYALTGRPCFLYVPDLANYEASDRELYFNVKDLPFINADSNDTLMKAIEQFNEKDYHINLALFLDTIGSYEEGRANEHLFNRINTICFGVQEDGI